MHGRVLHQLLFTLLLLNSSAAFAYVPAITPEGMPIRLSGRPRLALAGNPTNRSGLPAQAFFDAVTKGLQRWQSASNGVLDFDYWQGTDTDVYEPNSNYNGQSSVYFASRGSESMSPNTIGLTQVWYDVSSGRIIETDIVFNDVNFKFTENVWDTSGFGLPNGTAFSNRVYIQNVVTHELGHALGLSHSGNLQASMLYTESPEQALLSCDDQLAIRAIYPSNDAGSRARLSGRVVSENGSGIFGAQVHAISRKRGVSLATVLTGSDGSYQFNSLEPGTYFLMVEPYFPSATSLPSYFSKMNLGVCGGRSFGRSILAIDHPSEPTPISISSGQFASAPDLVARCPLSGSSGKTAIVNFEAPDTLKLTANGFGIWDRFANTAAASTNSYKVPAVNGNIEVHALSYSLYSPVEVSLALLDSRGNPVAGADSSNFLGFSGYVNYDSELKASGLDENEDYILQVQSNPLKVSDYPAGPIAMDSVPFVMITGSLNESEPSLISQHPRNARCEKKDDFAAYQSPSGNPPRQSTSSSGTGFCGSIRSDSSGGGGASPGAILGWLLPFFASFGIFRASKRGLRNASSEVTLEV